ncbi:MAG: hypothetical protein WAP35_01585 [Solirubrobacterales bacterium]
MLVRSRSIFPVLIAVLAAFVALPAAAHAEPPANISPPSVTPTMNFVVGEELTADPGQWSGDDLSFDYQWWLCSPLGADCASIPGEIASSYTPVVSDYARMIFVVVTATNLDGSDSVASDQVGPVNMPGVVLDNGSVQLGVRPTGELVEQSALDSFGNGLGLGTTDLGLRLKTGAYEAISDGSAGEGWGVADADTSRYGGANQDAMGLLENVRLVSFTASPSAAISVVDVIDAGTPIMRVTHHFYPSAGTNDLFEIAVDIEPLGGSSIGDLRYRRMVGWDVQPTALNEYVTIVPGDSPNVLATVDSEDNSLNPLDVPTPVMFSGEGFDRGSQDHGALFDLGFGPVPDGSSYDFQMFYGATADESAAIEALDAVGAEAFSFAQSSTADGPTLGTPATFTLAFAGIGGQQLLDDTLPETTITSGPPAHTNQSDVTIEFESDNPAATFECSIDFAPWESAGCESPMLLTGFAEARHLVLVRAVDGSGHDWIPASRQSEVDQTAPGISFHVTPDPESSSTTSLFMFDAEFDLVENVIFRCSLDGAPLTGCASAVGFPGQLEGPHTLVVEGSDLAGNVDPTISYSWYIETGTAPETSITNAPGAPLTTSTYAVTFTSNQLDAEYWCSIDGQSYLPCTSPKTLGPLSNGAHVFRVKAKDPSGFQDTTPAEMNFVVDALVAVVPPGPVPPTPPTMKLTKPKPGAKFLRLDATCPVTTCKLTGKVKSGKKTYKLAAKTLRLGTTSVTVRFGSALNKAIRVAKKKKSKSTYTLRLTGGGTKTLTGRF